MKIPKMEKNSNSPNYKVLNLIPDIFKNKINFIISTRNSSNLSFNTGDNRESVEYNRKIFYQNAGCNGNNVYLPEQIHGDNIVEIKENDLYLIPGTDALVTKEKKTVLSIMTADCLPILIYDPINEAFGIIHSGWKGTLLFLVTKTLDRMTKAFNTKAKDCHAVMGPAICSDCYEINDDLANKTKEAFKGKEIGIKRKNNKIYFDLVGINSLLLREAGLEKENIHKTGLCTSCLPGQFYSHRRDLGKTGRMMSLAWM
ncbi:MAG: peptidoglycan editing factor PgeF [bacterium]|nr:peptidoglycan editing factor PgeF [bacterium]